MKKFTYSITVFLFINILFISCSDNDVVREPLPDTSDLDFSTVQVQDFIWQGLNLFYYWKDNVPKLDNSRNDKNVSYFNLLNSSSKPDEFFESLIYDRQNTDKWSWIVDDYIALENSFAGININNGIGFDLNFVKDGEPDVYGYVKYVSPNSDASNKDIKRGDVFYGVNGVQLNKDNYRNLLFGNNTFTLNFADYINANIIPNGKSIEFTKYEYQENPVYVTKTFNIEGKKIGYMMYKSFNSSFNKEMNSAFGDLKSNGITDFVLDLRYNGGGSILTSTYLASLITGQFTGQLYAKEKWNAEIQEWLEANKPNYLNNNFIDEIIETNNDNEIIFREGLNSLNLSKVYIIATDESASASELVINGLKAYIDVILIGDRTHGKYTGSMTIYDSENFGREDVNPSHTWAMQPIVLETVNKLGTSIKGGIDPNHRVLEDFREMKEFGDITEPLLAKAIEVITGVATKQTGKKEGAIKFKKIFNSEDRNKFGNQLYIEKKLPNGLIIN